MPVQAVIVPHAGYYLICVGQNKRLVGIFPASLFSCFFLVCLLTLFSVELALLPGDEDALVGGGFIYFLTLQVVDRFLFLFFLVLREENWGGSLGKDEGDATLA